MEFKVEFGNALFPIGTRNPSEWDLMRPRILQNHGTRTVEIHSSGQEDETPADAFFTRKSRFPVSINTADCIPILLGYGGPDPWVMAVHAGWRGLHARILEKSIQHITQHWISSISLENLHLWIGPHIQKCCYEVGPEVANQFHEYGLPIQVAQSYLDLNAIVLSQIEKLGIQRVHNLGHCTKCHQTDGRFTYLSYRRGDRLSRQRSFIEFS